MINLLKGIIMQMILTIWAIAAYALGELLQNQFRIGLARMER